MFNRPPVLTTLASRKRGTCSLYYRVKADIKDKQAYRMLPAVDRGQALARYSYSGKATFIPTRPIL